MFRPSRNFADERNLPTVFTHDRERVRDLQFAAAAQGSKFASFQGGCINPKAMRYAWFGDLRQEAASVKMLVRCRRCEPCLKYRAYNWSIKGFAEVRASQRTWFGTLTVAPANRFIVQMKAEQALIDAGGSEKPSSSKLFEQMVKVLGRDLTLFVKRIRKNSGARIRYLLVAESHKDGFPHFHILLHEVEGQVTKRQLEAAWQIGFSNWRLVSSDNPKVVYYVTKYLTKSALTRVRASFRYGRDAERRITEQVLIATRALNKELSARASLSACVGYEHNTAPRPATHSHH